MSLRDIQIFNHRHYKLIRNICITVVLLAVFILPGILQIQRLDRQAVEIKGLNSQIKVLTQRNLDLSQQNIELNQQNIRHTDCVAKIFAQYTKDFVPVTFDDLDNCSTSGISAASLPGKVSSPSNPSKTPASSSASASGQATSPRSSLASSSSPQSAPSTSQTQPNLLQRLTDGIRGLFN